MEHSEISSVEAPRFYEDGKGNLIVNLIAQAHGNYVCKSTNVASRDNLQEFTLPGGNRGEIPTYLSIMRAAPPGEISCYPPQTKSSVDLDSIGLGTDALQNFETIVNTSSADTILDTYYQALKSEPLIDNLYESEHFNPDHLLIEHLLPIIRGNTGKIMIPRVRDNIGKLYKDYVAGFESSYYVVHKSPGEVVVGKIYSMSPAVDASDFTIIELNSPTIDLLPFIGPDLRHTTSQYDMKSGESVTHIRRRSVTEEDIINYIHQYVKNRNRRRDIAPIINIFVRVFDFSCSELMDADKCRHVNTSQQVKDTSRSFFDKGPSSSKGPNWGGKKQTKHRKKQTKHRKSRRFIKRKTLRKRKNKYIY